MPKYIGVTIGPIVDTLTKAKSTKEMWGASYLFSYIMKSVIKKLKDKEFVIPYIGQGEYLGEGNKAGLFHDRFIIEVKSDNDFKDVINAKDSVFNELVEDINKENKENKKITKDFLDKYIKFYLVEKELKEGENVIFAISEILDSLELNPQICEKELQKDHVFDYFSKNMPKLLDDAFGEKRNNEENKIKSLPEIAMRDGYNKLKNEEEQEKSKQQKDIDSLFEEAKEKDDVNSYQILSDSKVLKKHHKYYAIVRADGDNVGNVIKKLKSQSEYQEFSKKLFEFSTCAVEMIRHYEGLVVYAGGDDLLFFAPITNGNRNIFTLIDELSKEFNKKFEEEQEKPTLSFGISIQYYKDPMSKALSDSGTMLFGKAKNYKNKNAIGLKLLKHSGQPIEFAVEKGKGENEGCYNKFKKMLEEHSETKTLKGIIYTFENQKAILENIKNNETKISNFFVNNFKKKEHLDGKELNEYMKTVQSFITECGKNDELETGLKMLRFLAFLSEKGGE